MKQENVIRKGSPAVCVDGDKWPQIGLARLARHLGKLTQPTLAIFEAMYNREGGFMKVKTTLRKVKAGIWNPETTIVCNAAMGNFLKLAGEAAQRGDDSFFRKAAAAIIRIRETNPTYATSSPEAATDPLGMKMVNAWYEEWLRLNAAHFERPEGFPDPKLRVRKPTFRGWKTALWPLLESKQREDYSDPVLKREAASLTLEFDAEEGT